MCYQSSYFATALSKVSTETQSIGIHDAHLFNTELAMHYRAIILQNSHFHITVLPTALLTAALQ